MDVTTIELRADKFRLTYDVKGHFIVHGISSREARCKQCKLHTRTQTHAHIHTHTQMYVIYMAVCLFYGYRFARSPWRVK